MLNMLHRKCDLHVDHPLSGVRYIISVLSLCNTITFESRDVGSSFLHIRSHSGVARRDTGQICIWRSSGQDQGHMSEKGRKSLFPQCKTPIVNNSGKSGSIKHRTMKFACNMGFSNMADRMVWPLSLSRNRKWPRETKCTHSGVVGFRLKDNLILHESYMKLCCHCVLVTLVAVFLYEFVLDFENRIYLFSVE